VRARTRIVWRTHERGRQESQARRCPPHSLLSRYLVPADLTVGQFVYVIRKRIKLSPEKAIFIFVGNVLPPTAAMMSSVYEQNKDRTGSCTSLIAGKTHLAAARSKTYASSIDVPVTRLAWLHCPGTEHLASMAQQDDQCEDLPFASPTPVA